MSKLLTISDYQLTSKLGSGSFAKVYKAHTSENPESPVAVKVASHNKFKKDATTKVFKNEIKMHSQLDHPGIVKYLGSGIDSTLSKPSIGVTRQRCYIATEYCSGGDLFDVIKSKGGLSERQCKNYF